MQEHITHGRVHERFSPRKRVKKQSPQSTSFNQAGRVLPNLDTVSEGGTQGYEPEVAYTLSVAAGWAYADGQTLANKLEYYGLVENSVMDFEVTNTAMSIAAAAFLIRSKSGRVGVLSFRGTELESNTDLMTDCNVCAKLFGSEADATHVHAGLCDSVEVLWDDVEDALDVATTRDGMETHPKPLEVLYVTGHSLGGAMAVLAAARIFATPRFKGLLAGVYTFGAPAVGDEKFAQSCHGKFGERTFRHVNDCDVVPHFPPRECGEFFHFGTELTFDTNESTWQPSAGPSITQAQGRLVFALASAGLSYVARRLPRLLRGVADLPFPYSLDDHSPAAYIEKSRLSLKRLDEA
jgi:hypothetical protein